MTKSPRSTKSVTSPAPLWFGTFGATTEVFVDAASGAEWLASFSPAAPDWIRFTDGASGTGPDTLKLTADPNPAGSRTVQLRVRLAASGKTLFTRPVLQASAPALAALNVAVLELPFPNVPRVMELGIAGKFIAEQIQKIPEPFTLLGLIVVELLVVVAGLVAILLRALLSTIVPEPKTWFPGAPEQPIPFSALAKALPATAVFITEETYLLAIYIANETLGGA